MDAKMTAYDSEGVWFQVLSGEVGVIRNHCAALVAEARRRGDSTRCVVVLDNGLTETYA